MFKIKWVALILSGLPFFAFADSSLSQHPEWHRLLHYRSSLLGGYHSEADGKPFFLSPQGKNHPEAELQANIQALSLSPTALKELHALPEEVRDQHPLCRFPLRLKFLRIHFSGDDRHHFPLKSELNCVKYHKYKKRLATQSVSLAFTSYYLNNPSSAFGHTLLRMGKSPSGATDGMELLDEGINFAANPTTSNALLYAFMGLSGMFRGEFAAIPYFYKVREYNDFESRDIWSYDLNLTPEEIDRLEDHLWELGSTYFNYFYLTENCSYHLLTALEAAAPRLELTKHLPFWVIPSDTLQAVYKYQKESKTPFVRKISYRPSARATFYARENQLTETERTWFQKYRNRPLEILKDSQYPTLSVETKSHILDGLMDYVDFRDRGLNKDPILRARAELQVVSKPLVFQPPESAQPHKGHGSMRMGLMSGDSRQEGFFQQFETRFAFHDLLDPLDGSPRHSTIEFGHLIGRVLWEKPGVQAKLTAEEIRVFQVYSLAPWNQYERPISWRVHLGAKRLYDRNCNHCFAPSFETAGGLTVPVFSKKLTASLLGDFESQYSSAFYGSNGRISIGSRAVLSFDWNNSWRSLAEIYHHYLFFSQSHYTWGSTLRTRKEIVKNLAVDIGINKGQDRQEYFGGLYFYF